MNQEAERKGCAMLQCHMHAAAMHRSRSRINDREHYMNVCRWWAVGLGTRNDSSQQAGATSSCSCSSQQGGAHLQGGALHAGRQPRVLGIPRRAPQLPRPAAAAAVCAPPLVGVEGGRKLAGGGARHSRTHVCLSRHRLACMPLDAALQGKGWGQDGRGGREVRALRCPPGPIQSPEATQLRCPPHARTTVCGLYGSSSSGGLSSSHCSAMLDLR